MSLVSAQNLRKRYKDVHALDGFSFSVEPGQIVGLIGPNGSGKTTAINALLGLNSLDSGELAVLGMDPGRQRPQLMQQVAYIADTGILPKWMRVVDLLEFVERVHPAFNRDIAHKHLANTQINKNKRVRVLSKGMHVQLHLAIVLAINAPLLILDEPTLGLDVLYRQQFYDAILNDYFVDERSILVTTHEVREIEHILTDVVFINKGREALTLNMATLPEHYIKLVAAGDVTLPATPVAAKTSIKGTEYIFRDVPREALAGLGDTSTPNLVELFVAVVNSAQDQSGGTVQ